MLCLEPFFFLLNFVYWVSLVFFFLLFLLCLWDRVSLCSTCRPGTCYVIKIALNSRDPLASTSCVLGLKICPTMPDLGFACLFFNRLVPILLSWPSEYRNYKCSSLHPTLKVTVFFPPLWRQYLVRPGWSWDYASLSPVGLHYNALLLSAGCHSSGFWDDCSVAALHHSHVSNISLLVLELPDSLPQPQLAL